MLLILLQSYNWGWGGGSSAKFSLSYQGYLGARGLDPAIKCIDSIVRICLEGIADSYCLASSRPADHRSWWLIVAVMHGRPSVTPVLQNYTVVAVGGIISRGRDAIWQSKRNKGRYQIYSRANVQRTIPCLMLFTSRGYTFWSMHKCKSFNRLDQCSLINFLKFMTKLLTTCTK